MFLFFILHCYGAIARKPRVLFISPEPKITNQRFWTNFLELTIKAANDLDIELEIEYASGNRFSALKLAKKALNEKAPPDFLLMLAYRGTSLDVLKLAEKKKVKTIFVNTEIDEKEKRELGNPREKFKYWIANIFPDDFQAGYKLGNGLLDYAKKSGSAHSKLIGFSGTYDTSVSFKRVDGLRSVIKDRKQEVEFKQLFNGKWDETKSGQLFKIALERYPDSNIVWSAGGGMSLGALAILEGKKNPHHFILGDIDWSPHVLEKLIKGDLKVVVGGHFAEGAWSMVLIKDYFEKIDFTEDLGTRIKTNFFTITSEEIQKKKKYFTAREWLKINYKSYSKYFNPKIKKYNFKLYY